MPRKLKGIRRRGNRWEAYVRIEGHLYSTTFPLDTPLDEMRTWRDDQLATRGVDDQTTVGSLRADITAYLARVSSMPTYKQRAAHLELWARALGRERPRGSITAGDIDEVLQEWLLTLTPGTVRKRRTALQSFFAKMNGKKSRLVNPVKASENPIGAKPAARGLDYFRIANAIAAMPTQRDTKKGQPARLSLSAIRARVLAYTGIPPGILQQIQPTDLSIADGTVRVVPRHKGAGVEARTLPLTADALDAFKAFHAANAYGPFSIVALNRSFKRGCKAAGLDPKTIHLYDLRHSFLTALYLVTRDLATVGRLGLHAEGSKVTARYAKGADYAVDSAAAAALNQFLSTSRQLSLKLAPAPRPAVVGK
jgi:integrase